MKDTEKLIDMMTLIRRSGFLKKGSIETLPNGSFRIRPTIGGSLGKNCPFCGSDKIKADETDSSDAMMEFDAHVWTAYSCSCPSCQRSYMRLINEIGEPMAICGLL
jgi:hypothetical protein